MSASTTNWRALYIAAWRATLLWGVTFHTSKVAQQVASLLFTSFNEVLPQSSCCTHIRRYVVVSICICVGMCVRWSRVYGQYLVIFNPSTGGISWPTQLVGRRIPTYTEYMWDECRAVLLPRSFNYTWVYVGLWIWANFRIMVSFVWVLRVVFKSASIVK